MNTLNNDVEIMGLILEKVVPEKSQECLEQLKKMGILSIAYGLDWFTDKKSAFAGIFEGDWLRIRKEYAIFNETFRPDQAPSNPARQLFLSSVVKINFAAFPDSEPIGCDCSALNSSLKRLLVKVEAGNPAPEQLSRKFLNKVWEFCLCDKALVREDALGNLKMDATIYEGQRPRGAWAEIPSKLIELKGLRGGTRNNDKLVFMQSLDYILVRAGLTAEFPISILYYTNASSSRAQFVTRRCIVARHGLELRCTIDREENVLQITKRGCNRKSLLRFVSNLLSVSGTLFVHSEEQEENEIPD